MRRALLLITIWLTLPCGLAGRAAEAEANAPGIELPLRGTDQKVGLNELRGRIVVLDFFAHWCVPCARSSAEVETGIRSHYSGRQSNAHGVPVSVFAVNLEAARPEKTEAFIKRTGMKQVLDDPNGDVFQKYGGSSVPFLVIIDATGGSNGTASPQIVYRKAGFEGVARLRQVIDAIQVRHQSPVAVAASPASNLATATQESKTEPQPQTRGPISHSSKTNRSKTPPGTTAATPPAVVTGSAVVHRVGLDFAMLWASDIFLTDEFVQYRQARPRSEVTFSVSHGHIGLDYVPESSLEENNHVEDERYGLQAEGRVGLGERVTLLGGGGAYDGFLDYRSLWLDEHFRQVFSGRSGYEKAHPWGWNASGGVRWECVPACAFVQGDLIYQHDIISPGYDVRFPPFPPRLVRFRDTYETLSGRLTLENVLTRRLRARQELQITDTTDRQLRFAFQTSLNVALAEHWVARLAGGYTSEEPQLEAWFGGASIEHDWNETWFVSLFGRYYTDTGQIENALLAENTASPPLETCEAGLGLRWQGLKSSAKLLVGPYLSRYESTSNSANLFGHLYQDRDWLCVQFAFAHEF